jgi:hypothetical protein
LCDVLQYVSAQALVFLDLEQKSTFPIWKRRCAHPVFPDGHELNSRRFAAAGRRHHSGSFKAHFTFLSMSKIPGAALTPASFKRYKKKYIEDFGLM